MVHFHTRCFASLNKIHDIGSLLSIIQFIKSDQWRDSVQKMWKNVWLEFRQTDENVSKTTHRKKNAGNLPHADVDVWFYFFSSLEFPCVIQQPTDIVYHHAHVKNATKPFEIKIFYGLGFRTSKRFILKLALIEMYFNKFYYPLTLSIFRFQTFGSVYLGLNSANIPSTCHSSRKLRANKKIFGFPLKPRRLQMIETKLCDVLCERFSRHHHLWLPLKLNIIINIQSALHLSSHRKIIVVVVLVLILSCKVIFWHVHSHANTRHAAQAHNGITGLILLLLTARQIIIIFVPRLYRFLRVDNFTEYAGQ